MPPIHFMPPRNFTSRIRFQPRGSFLFATIFVVTLAIHCQNGFAADEIDFGRDVRPILSETCFHCHGPDEATREADLRLDQASSAMGVIVAGRPDESELIRRIRSTDPDERMPPADSRKQLNGVQIDLIEAWVESGAAFEEHWAFVPPVASEPPKIASHPPKIASHPIDAFVQDRLRRENLTGVEPADRATLIRRLSLDLIGLPPSPAEVDAFVADRSPQAVERLIDRLMQSPRYGEHMALSWLEGSRYADTDGYQNDRYRYQHVWRDWVIEAFNSNMPYDQFVIEQLAGDMLPEATLRQQIATGFGRNHRINSEDGSIPEEWRTENVVDRVDTFGTLFLGLTIGCARCHDHKYDPISQQEYYQLFAYFNNIAEWGVGPNNGNSPPFIEVPKSWPHLSPGEDRMITPDPVELRSARKEAGNGLKRPQAGSPSTVMVMHELEQPRETFLLRRGQYNMPDKSKRLEPGAPSSLHRQGAEMPNDRLELARWLVSPDNPLTARVAVNRIWQQFFGTGLVETSENFGSQGAPPSHPRLLDWLSVELVRQDWDLRAIQRLILTSATYQQSSAITTDSFERDPQNRLLARGPRVRLPGFTLRDQVLWASGLLVDKIGGPSAKPYMPPKIWSAISNNKYKQDSGENLFRRSLYTYWRRTIPPPTMMNFNAAAREICIVRTEPTNTPLQALTLMNNKTFVESARCLAERMIHNSDEPTDQIEYGFRLLCARRPSKPELDVLTGSHDRFLKLYHADPGAAGKLLDTGDTGRDDSIPPVLHAAMTLTASLIMNLDEAITKE